eukprot:TRINITY_DN56854_c0_g1_i1.p1 TRINITY_DN56854_c0_g1~~TRINITY_DN56854_c0_g1_i1.p1  ORF type:complete len:221 (-),score=30.48 TRINITY_DN56854_c0_g1_i1:452-1114(-)
MTSKQLPCKRGMSFGIVVAATCLQRVAASSTYLAKLCQGHRCTEPAFPLLDYSAEKGECVCRAHPCWDDDGKMHHCKEKQFPHYQITYSEDGQLSCRCSSIPRAESVHIARDKCPGHRCDEADNPVLDLDSDGKTCVCRSHPCWDMQGEKHACDKPEFPILNYREDKGSGKQGIPVCECAARYLPPNRGDELREFKPRTNDYDDDEESGDFLEDLEDEEL